ncbi:MFS transporter [Pontibacter sp. G13]|uniref:MFS transporter n=1 Tax=Pontibacter sp. G13 TaxID=3074898 RepID=UPI00288B50B1|nr:MFS transporter [Pontibacter sp. G13]WNJ20474.1 MFS transporter [Pontibacter sp. G13]
MKGKGLRWWIIGLIALATVINYIDRTALAVMWPEVSKDLGMDKNDYANILLIFTVAYGLGKGLFGRIMDWIGVRFGFVLAIFVWSVAAALHAVARGVGGFAFYRVLLGLGESGNWPGATKASAIWFPIKERAFAQGIFNSGAALGSVIAAPSIAFLYLAVGWKATFVIIGAVGLLWIIPWWIINKANPDKHPWLSDEEREYILSGQKTQAEADEATPAYSWGKLLTFKETWAILISRFLIDPIWWLFVNWLPIYLAESFGFQIKDIGAFAWLPYVGAALGSLSGGWVAARWIGRGMQVGKVRKSIITIGGMIMLPCLIMTAFASTPMVAITLIGLILFGFQFVIGNLQTLPSDFFSGKSVGSVAGLGGLAASAGVLVTTKIVPMLSADGNYLNVFLLGAVLVPLGVAAIYLLGGNIERVKTTGKAPHTHSV